MWRYAVLGIRPIATLILYHHTLPLFTNRTRARLIHITCTQFHVGPLLDAIHEDRAVVDAWKKKLAQVQAQVTNVTYTHSRTRTHIRACVL